MSDANSSSQPGAVPDKKPPVPAPSAEEWVCLLIESAHDFAIMTADLDLLVTFWNSGAERILGYTEEEILGQSSRIFFTPEDRASMVPEKERDTALKTGRSEDERWHLRKDGSRFWGSGVAMPLKDDQGNTYGIVKIFRDLTERKAAEDALKEKDARLVEANEALEARVQERTKKLEEAQQELRNEIENRRRLERATLEASEREQRRMGQDLHDTLCQELAGLSLACKAIARRIAPQLPEETKQIVHIGDLLIKTVGETRKIARGLHPIEFEKAGLSAALRELADSVGSGIRCRFEGPERPTDLDPVTALHLYRIAQEAVTNAVKHSSATEIEISLGADGVTVLRISDNGRGFDPERSTESSMGMELMKYRASVIEAKLSISSELGSGTIVECVVPSRQKV